MTINDTGQVFILLMIHHEHFSSNPFFISHLKHHPTKRHRIRRERRKPRDKRRALVPKGIKNDFDRTFLPGEVLMLLQFFDMLLVEEISD
jgi:hypothetical protein